MARDEAYAGEERQREYLYSLCATCRMKVNVNAFRCPRCKNRVDYNANKDEWTNGGVYASGDAGDRIYSIRLCSVEHCMACKEALGGKPCRYVYCYGTGRGKCALCGKFEAVRYACCQERQRENAAFAAERAIQNDPARGKLKE
jgi:hypothetical protein